LRYAPWVFEHLYASREAKQIDGLVIPAEEKQVDKDLLNLDKSELNCEGEIGLYR